MHSDRGIWDSYVFVWNITDLIGSDAAIIQHGEGPAFGPAHSHSLTHRETHADHMDTKVQVILSQFHQYVSAANTTVEIIQSAILQSVGMVTVHENSHWYELNVQD